MRAKGRDGDGLTMTSDPLSGLGQISYAAGSSSLDPSGFRVLVQDDSQKFAAIVREFPRAGELLQPHSVCISAYPAALGIRGFDVFIDSYLHPPTVIRGFRLAQLHHRSIVFASQPLAGADLLLQVIRANQQMPPRVLWAVGGYYLPMSLEAFIRAELLRYGCQLDVLHCYGVAEIGHTCFAAMERTVKGLPIYSLVDAGVEARQDHTTGRLQLSREGRSILTEDYAEREKTSWLIRSGASRLHPTIERRLESWSTAQWRRRTGYLGVKGSRLRFQLRQGMSPETSSEIRFHGFWEQCGGSWLTKPLWNQSVQTRKRAKVQLLQPA